MKCAICKIREGTERHHGIITRAQARNVSPDARAIVESALSTLYLCNKCHTGKGHIARSMVFVAVDSKYGEGTAAKILAEFNTKVRGKLGAPKPPREATLEI